MIINSPLSPALQAAIDATCKDAAFKTIAYLPKLDYNEFQEWLNAVTKFVKENFRSMGAVPYLIEYDHQATGIISKFGPKEVLGLLKNGANVICLSKKIEISGIATVPSFSATDISTRSRSGKSVLAHVLNGKDIRLYADGGIAKEFNVDSPMSGPMEPRVFSRFATDYKLSAIECFRERIQYYQQTKHWKDRKNRVLVDSNTEEVFHDCLYRWLDENLHGASTFTKTKLISSDQTDIEVRMLGGRFFVIEVKWLGTNGSTTYSESKIGDGINQVNTYLVREPHAEEACLIVYDGRSLDKFRTVKKSDNEEIDQWKCFKESGASTLAAKGTGLIFFLESEDASSKKTP